MSDKKDLDLKVATEKEAMWIMVRDTLTEKIKQQENELEVNREVLKLAKNKILLEQRK